MTWYAHIGIAPHDLELMRDVYTDKLFSIEDHDYGPLIYSAQFDGCDCAKEVRSLADELLSHLNLALTVAQPQFEGITLRSIAEKNNCGFNWTVFAEPAQIAIRGGAVKFTIINEKGEIVENLLPSRTFAERMTELMVRDSRVTDAARALHANPISWGQLNLAYETIKGLMSQRQDRADWKNLVLLGWISEKDSRRFWQTAGHFRHGHPRKPLNHPNPMSIEEARRVIRDLFRQFVDHMQPQ